MRRSWRWSTFQVSTHIQCVCRWIWVKELFKCHGALRELLMKVKSPQPELLKKEVVYKVPYMNYDDSHILNWRDRWWTDTYSTWPNLESISILMIPPTTPSQYLYLITHNHYATNLSYSWWRSVKLDWCELWDSPAVLGSICGVQWCIIVDTGSNISICAVRFS